MFQFKKYKHLFFITFIVLVNYSQTGIVIGWTSPNLSKLQSPNSTIPTSSNQGYWMANVIPLSSSCATPLAAILIHYFGRKVVMAFIPVPFLLTWLMIAFSKSADFIIGARVFGGLGVALLYTLTPIYLGEISPVELRSSIGILMTVFTSLGTLWVYIFGNQFNILVSSLLNLVPTGIFISLLIFLPETPYYLIKKGKNKEGYEILCKIRQDGGGGKSLQGCQHEFSSISKNTNIVREVGESEKSPQCCQHEFSDISKSPSIVREVGDCGESPQGCQHEFSDMSKNTAIVREVGECAKSPQGCQHEFSNTSNNNTIVREVGNFGKPPQCCQHEFSDITNNTTIVREVGKCAKSPQGCQHEFSIISKNTNIVREVGECEKCPQCCQHELSDISKSPSIVREIGDCEKSPQCCKHEFSDISKSPSIVREVGKSEISPQYCQHEFSDISKNPSIVPEVGESEKSLQGCQHEFSDISKSPSIIREVGDCGKSPQGCQHEFSDLSKNSTIVREVRDCGETPQGCQHEFNEMSKNITNINLKDSFREFWIVKRHKKALFISSMAHFTSQMTGGPIIYFFSQTIFEKAGNFSPNLFSIIVQISQLLSCIFSVFLVGHTGNRPLLITSCLGSAIFMATTGLYFYFLNNSYDLTNFWWVPLFSIVAFNVFQMVGVQAIPIAFMGEFFDLKVKPFCVCISKISMALSIFLVGIIFQALNENFGSTAPFFVFAFFGIFGMIFFYFWVPETRGRTLQEIQFYFENGKYEK